MFCHLKFVGYKLKVSHLHITYFWLPPPMAQQPLAGQGLITKSSQSPSDTPHSVGLLWTSD
jgi:hypothetical protein